MALAHIVERIHAGVLPATPPNTRWTWTTILHIGLALMALVSLNPYLIWGEQKYSYGFATLIVLASLPFCAKSMVVTRERLLLALFFALFLVYLSLLPKEHGGTTRWYFLIPFTVSVLLLAADDLRRTFDKFYWVFSLSLIPGIVVWLWLVAGLPLEVRWTTPPAHIVQRGVIDYFEFPGAIMLPYNAMVLPNGGFMARLCAIYDEPGTVGTVAALCLAATRFRLGDPRSAISFVAGVMSFSIAFSVLVTLGLLVRCVASRQPALVAAALLSALAGLIPLSGAKFYYESPPMTRIEVLRPAGQHAGEAAEESVWVIEHFNPGAELRLRFSDEFDNRAQPGMQKLFDRYLQSNIKTQIFGLSSDASVVYGQGSSVWYRLLTDFGIAGFIWAGLLFATPAFLLWRRRNLPLGAALFCLLFLMSFYQRPIVWLPAQLLIYFAGLSYPTQLAYLQRRSRTRSDGA